MPLFMFELVAALRRGLRDAIIVGAGTFAMVQAYGLIVGLS